MAKTAKKLDQGMWEAIVWEVKQGSKYGASGSWNARKAQYAVKLYKESGGRYLGPKTDDNSLSKWTKQDWQYEGGEKGSHEGRYLPKKVWDKLSDFEKKETNAAKKRANLAGKKKAKYTKKVAALVSEA